MIFFFFLNGFSFLKIKSGDALPLGKSTIRRFCKVQHFTVHQTAWSKEVQRDYCDKAAPFIGLVGFLAVRSHECQWLHKHML